MNALTFISLTGAIERQGGAVGWAVGQPHIRPLLAQPDRVAALRALGLSIRADCFFGRSSGRRMIGLSPGSVGGTTISPRPVMRRAGTGPAGAAASS